MQTDKLYYTIGEVAEMYHVKHSLIRFWEKEFGIIHLHKNNKGNRLFTKKDLQTFDKIYNLVKVQGYTLEGAKKVFKLKTEVATLPTAERFESKENLINKLLKIRKQLEMLKSKF
jgi:DNA-binding transcriptional MerR regulator